MCRTIEWRHTQGRSELFAGFARELVSLPVDLMIASSMRAAVDLVTAQRGGWAVPASVLAKATAVIR